MTLKFSLAALALALISITAPADARVGSDAQGLRQRDAIADPAVKIFREGDHRRHHGEYSYLKRHNPGFNARTRCGHKKYWNGDECVWR